MCKCVSSVFLSYTKGGSTIYVSSVYRVDKESLETLKVHNSRENNLNNKRFAKLAPIGHGILLKTAIKINSKNIRQMRWNVWLPWKCANETVIRTCDANPQVGWEPCIWSRLLSGKNKALFYVNEESATDPYQEHNSQS